MTIPLLTLVNCLLELLRCGGSYTLLQKLWGCFRANLGPGNPLYNLNWSRSESLVSFVLFSYTISFCLVSFVLMYNGLLYG